MGADISSEDAEHSNEFRGGGQVTEQRSNKTERGVENETPTPSEVKRQAMSKLASNIQEHGKHIGHGIIKLNSFINHQVDCVLMDQFGQVFADHFRELKPTKVLTVVSSGILPAQPTAKYLEIPMIYARESASITFSKHHKKYVANSTSHTSKKHVQLHVSGEFLCENDRVLIIDDFLATGITLKAMFELVKQAGATVVGTGVIMEKTFEGGWKDFTCTGKEHIEFLSLGQINGVDGESIEFTTS